MKKAVAFVACSVAASFLTLSPNGNANEFGKAVYESQCVACHASNGSGNDALGSPSIAGMPAEYLVLQLKNYRGKVRGAEAGDTQGAMMAATATGLSDQAIEDVASFLSQQSVPDLELKLDDSMQPFNPFMARGAFSSCTSCHGATGLGNQILGAPRIAQQYPSYVRRQLNNFRSGLRGSHPDDTMGQQMHLIASQISDESTIDTILAYLVFASGQ